MRVVISVVSVLFGIVSTPLQANSFLRSCREVWLIWSHEPDITKQRIFEFLPEFREQYLSDWQLAASITPEEDQQLTTQQAVTFLEGYPDGFFLGWGAARRVNRHWGNAIYFLPREGRKAVLKKNQLRSSIEGDRAVAFTSLVRYEVLAFAIDRYLGTNLVPPFVLRNESEVLGLYIPGRTANFSELTASPKYLVTVTHLRILDTLLGNFDRNAKGNIIISATGKPVAIDFDMARPFERYYGFPVPLNYVSQNVIIDRSRFFGRSGPVPGVVSLRVKENLERLDESTLRRVAAEKGLILSSNEVAHILGAKQYLLLSIDLWAQSYGEDLIYIP